MSNVISANHGRPRRARKTLLVLLYLAFLGVCAEAGAFVVIAWRVGRILPGEDLERRMYEVAQDPSETPDQTAEGDRHSRIHPYLGFMYRQAAGEAVENGVLVYQPEFYQDTSPVFSRSPDKIVIAILGGSVANHFARFGGTQALRELVEGIPLFSGKAVEFAVLAYGGVKQPQQLIGLAYLLALGGSVDVVINLDGFNEVALHELENQRQGVSTVYPRAWFFRVQRAEVLPLLGRLRYEREARKALARSARDSPFHPSWIYRLVWLLRDDHMERTADRTKRELMSFIPDQRRDLVLSGPPSPGTNAEERLDELIALWKNGSIQLDRLCSANGIRYFHFLQPNQYVPGSKRLSEQEKLTAHHPQAAYAQWAPRGYVKLIETGRGLVEQGVLFHDLTSVFADVEETIYVETCCHVNEAGNVLMAAAIADFIRDSTE